MIYSIWPVDSVFVCVCVWGGGGGGGEVILGMECLNCGCFYVQTDFDMLELHTFSITAAAMFLDVQRRACHYNTPSSQF